MLKILRQNESLVSAEANIVIAFLLSALKNG
jgi:hypothetical protein